MESVRARLRSDLVSSLGARAGLKGNLQCVLLWDHGHPPGPRQEVGLAFAFVFGFHAFEVGRWGVRERQGSPFGWSGIQSWYTSGFRAIFAREPPSRHFCSSASITKAASLLPHFSGLWATPWPSATLAGQSSLHCPSLGLEFLHSFAGTCSRDRNHDVEIGCWKQQTGGHFSQH